MLTLMQDMRLSLCLLSAAFTGGREKNKKQIDAWDEMLSV